MTDTDSDTRNSRSTFLTVIVVLAVIVGLIFAPLMASIFEGVVFHTHKVEDFFRWIGLFEPLGRIYEPVVRLFER